jgi:integrase
VAAWVEDLQEKHGAPGVKQQRAAVRMLFDWVITGQQPVAQAARRHYPTDTVRDLRDRALIGTLTYALARIGAVLKMKVEDFWPHGTGWQIHLHEKGGKEHKMPCHHALSEMLHASVAAAGIADDRKGWLFRTSPGHTATVLTEQPMDQSLRFC